MKINIFLILGIVTMPILFAYVLIVCCVFLVSIPFSIIDDFFGIVLDVLQEKGNKFMKFMSYNIKKEK
jgi:hypothetical protein